MQTRVYFASNRDIKYETSKNSDNFGERFNAMGPQFFRVGRSNVTLKDGADPRDEDNWNLGRTTLYDESQKTEDRQQGLGSARMFDDLRRMLKDDERDILVYIHGFASTFKTAATRAAQLRSIYGEPGREPVTFFFSWPANGRTWPSANYFSDREDAEMSGIAMARALQRLIEFLRDLRDKDRRMRTRMLQEADFEGAEKLVECQSRMHLVAHSMGNYALRQAVQKLKEFENGQNLPRVFDHAFLMAADADADALGKQFKLAPLLELAAEVHVYHARNDRALQISDATKGNAARLGAEGPTGLELLDPRIYTIDCQDVSDTSVRDGRHQYYRLRSEVIEDVRQTLEGVPGNAASRKGRVETRPGRSWRLQKD